MVLCQRLGDVLIALALRASARARRRRAKLFLDVLNPKPGDKILDLGSDDGAHTAAILPFREGVSIADIDAEALERGRRTYGFEPVLIDESGALPFPDGYFDIVFCSSVLEHVTVPKMAVRQVCSRRDFDYVAFRRQREFAREIQRVGRRFFVQTPYRYFPVETHTWLPALIVFLPRQLQLRLVQWLNRWWIKTTQLDFHLLTLAEMQELFPDAEIRFERFLGLRKSLIAIG